MPAKEPRNGKYIISVILFRHMFDMLDLLSYCHLFEPYFFFPSITTLTPPLASMTNFSSDEITLANTSSMDIMLLPIVSFHSLLSLFKSLSPVFSATERNPPSSPPTLNPEWPNVYTLELLIVQDMRKHTTLKMKAKT